MKLEIVDLLSWFVMKEKLGLLIPTHGAVVDKADLKIIEDAKNETLKIMRIIEKRIVDNYRSLM